MGNPLSNYSGDSNLENDCTSISAFFALDGSSNVIGYQPTTSPPTAVGPYSRALGMQKALGQAGSVINQPHTSAGTYIFTLDEPWFGAVEAWVMLTDQGAVAQLAYAIDCNVGSNQLKGAFPGNNPALAAQTVRVLFRANATGALTNPVANTGFWLGLKLKRKSIV